MNGQMDEQMDEQRVAAYVRLIEQLLGCEQGREAEVVQENMELVDAGLLEVMKQYADWMESQGTSNPGWLRSLAGQLAKALGMVGDKLMGAASGDAQEFLIEIVQLIIETEGNRMKVYEFFRVNLERLNQGLLAALPEVFEELIRQNDAGFSAAVFVEFRNLIQQFPLGPRWLTLELGIAAYHQSLTIMTENAMPVEWAQTMMNLANAYSNRIHGDRAENIEQAIACYEKSMTVMTKNAMPVEWATSMNNLANAYKNRIRGNRAENIEQAIVCYEKSMTVMTESAMPVEWAQTMMNLANAYSGRIRGDKAENIEQAIALYESALTICTRETFPLEWARTQSNLAAAFFERVRGERAKNVEQAIALYESALTVFTREAFPEHWARIQNNLAATKGR